LDKVACHRYARPYLVPQVLQRPADCGGYQSSPTCAFTSLAASAAVICRQRRKGCQAGSQPSPADHRGKAALKAAPPVQQNQYGDSDTAGTSNKDDDDEDDEDNAWPKPLKAVGIVICFPWVCCWMLGETLCPLIARLCRQLYRVMISAISYAWEPIGWFCARVCRVMMRFAALCLDGLLEVTMNCLSALRYAFDAMLNIVLRALTVMFDVLVDTATLCLRGIRYAWQWIRTAVPWTVRLVKRTLYLYFVKPCQQVLKELRLASLKLLDAAAWCGRRVWVILSPSLTALWNLVDKGVALLLEACFQAWDAVEPLRDATATCIVWTCSRLWKVLKFLVNETRRCVVWVCYWPWQVLKSLARVLRTFVVWTLSRLRQMLLALWIGSKRVVIFMGRCSKKAFLLARRGIRASCRPFVWAAKATWNILKPAYSWVWRMLKSAARAMVMRVALACSWLWKALQAQWTWTKQAVKFLWRSFRSTLSLAASCVRSSCRRLAWVAKASWNRALKPAYRTVRYVVLAGLAGARSLLRSFVGIIANLLRSVKEIARTAFRSMKGIMRSVKSTAKASVTAVRTELRTLIAIFR